MGAPRAGIGTLSVAAATVACGLLLLGGVAPSRGLPGDQPIPPPGSDPYGTDPGDEYETTTTSVTAPPTTTETSLATSTTMSSTTTTTMSPTTSTSTTTSPPTSPPTTTTTTATSTSVATAPPPVPARPPLPLSVGQSATIVGAGGTVDFDGICPVVARNPLGPLVVDIISAEAERLDTGITAENWAYEWTAPTDPDAIATHTFQFWCGDPSEYQGGYPLELQRTVDVVAQATATTTTAAPNPGGSPPTGTIPSTG